MLSYFDLKEGCTFETFKAALDDYSQHMLDMDLIVGIDPVGIRHSDTILDTDDDRDQQYFFLMNFEDVAQSDRAVAHIESATEPAATIHIEMYALIKNARFICWRDAD